MANARSAIATFALCVVVSAVQISPYLDHPGTNTDGAEAPLLQVVLLLAAMEAFFTAVTFMYVHIHNGGGGGAGAGNRRIPEEVIFILCASIGVLVLFLFVQPDAMVGAQAPPLRLASDVLLPAATVTFFLAMTLIYVHVRNGGGGGAGAGNWQIQAYVELLTKMTLGATLVSLMAIVLAVYTKSTPGNHTMELIY